MPIERTYNVPLRREWLKAPRYKRAKKAIAALKKFLIRHMKSDNISIGKNLNEEIWKHGIRNPPHHVKINVLKEDDGKVYAELIGYPLKPEIKAEEKPKKEEKKEEKPTGVEEREKRLEEKREKIKKEKEEEAKKKEKEIEVLEKKKEKAEKKAKGKPKEKFIKGRGVKGEEKRKKEMAVSK